MSQNIQWDEDMWRTDIQMKGTELFLSAILLPFFFIGEFYFLFISKLKLRYFNGWKVHVPDDQLEHGFHQISEFPRGCSSDLMETKKYEQT